MNKPYIEFRKNSNFSGILTDTFGFLRNEFKPLIKAILNIAGPAILIYLLSLTVYNYVASGTFAFSDIGNPRYNFGNVFSTLISALIYFVSAIAAYIFTVSTVLLYMKSYVDNKGMVDIEGLKGNVYKHFWSMLGLGILKGLTIFISLILCFLPFLYFMVPMSVVYAIHIFEPRTSASEAYAKGFSIVNSDFWTAWGSWLVLLIIQFVIIYVFAIVTSLYSIIDTGIFSGEIDPAKIDQLGRDPILILINIVQTFVQLLLNMILVVGGVVIYLHLKEKISFIGTYERIGEIGKIEE